MIRLKRRAEWADLLRSYKIIVDGNVMGTIRRGQEVTLEVEPGQHFMWLRIDWTGSNGISFVHDGSTLELECGSNFAGWKAFGAFKPMLHPGLGGLWLRFKGPTPPGAAVLSETPGSRSMGEDA
jgi:hypothetical protein